MTQPISQHHLFAAGWTGEGQCGVRCVCGTAFDGFDSLEEARALLDRHIADAAPPVDPARAELAQVLRRLADEIVENNLPIPAYRLHISGCLGSRDDVQRWAEHLGVTVTAGGTGRDIPVASRDIPAGDLVIEVAMQGPVDTRSEIERLREENLRLRLQLGGGESR